MHFSDRALAECVCEVLASWLSTVGRKETRVVPIIQLVASMPSRKPH